MDSRGRPDPPTPTTLGVQKEWEALRYLIHPHFLQTTRTARTARTARTTALPTMGTIDPFALVDQHKVAQSALAR